LELGHVQEWQFLDRIDQATQRLMTLVTEILDIAHLQADPLILERRPVSFAALVARLRGDLVATSQDPRLATTQLEDLPLLEVDPVRVGQVLENVVGNALKYAPPNSPITIGAITSAEWLTVTIDDEGLG